MKKEKMVQITIKNGAEFTVEVPESKVAEIFGAGYGKVKLSTLKAGETFSTGKHDWVVLEQSGDTTAVIHKDCLEDLRRFDANSNNWIKSEIRKWLNSEFAEEIVKEIGLENIVEHKPDLSTDDGTDKYGIAEDMISLISCNNYRKYRKFIPKTDKWYWTLTALSTEDGNTSYVRCVYWYGTLNFYFVYFSDGGVRPFCIFKSNILVSKGE